MRGRSAIETHPLTPERWRDFAALMSSRFDTRWCWCMALRRPDSYKRYTPGQNRRAIKRAVDTSPAPPGVLAYVDGVPAGWCAVAPREEFRRIARSRTAAPAGDSPVWAIVCFFVPTKMRRRGVSRVLLAAALDLARAQGARTVEAYPVEGTRNLFRGVPSVFLGAGFAEAARLAPKRPVLRYAVRRARRVTRR